MSRQLSKAIATLRSSLNSSAESVAVTVEVSPEVASKVLRLLEVENAGGALVLRGHDEFSPAEVSVLLGVSRATVMARINDGSLTASRSGSRWVITADAVVAFQQQQDEAKLAVRKGVANLASGIGLPPPPGPPPASSD